MHDIGKVQTPQEVLNKPGKLSKEEFDIMKRHVVDGAHILRRTPEMPALAPIVAFEHHLRQDLSGYPANIGHRKLNLCTQIVSIADVYDALRSNRVYREGLPSDRIKCDHGARRTDPAFNQRLLRRFINLIGHVSGRHARPPEHRARSASSRTSIRPIRSGRRSRSCATATAASVEEPLLVNTWEPDGRGDFTWAVVEAVDPDAVQHRSADVHVTDGRSCRTPRSTTTMALRLAEFARACKAALRAVSLYPGGHPAIGSTLGRLTRADRRA